MKFAQAKVLLFFTQLFRGKLKHRMDPVTFIETLLTCKRIFAAVRCVQFTLVLVVR